MGELASLDVEEAMEQEREPHEPPVRWRGLCPVQLATGDHPVHPDLAPPRPMSPSVRVTDTTTRAVGACFEQCDDLPKMLVDHLMGDRKHTSVMYALAKTSRAFRVAVRGAIGDWCDKYTKARDELIEARTQLVGFVAHEKNKHELGVWIPPTRGYNPEETEALLADKVAVRTYKLAQMVDAQFGAGFADVYQNKALVIGRMDDATFREMTRRRCRICQESFRPDNWVEPAAKWREAMHPCQDPGLAFAHNACVNKHLVRVYVQEEGEEREEDGSVRWTPNMRARLLTSLSRHEISAVLYHFAEREPSPQPFIRDMLEAATEASPQLHMHMLERTYIHQCVPYAYGADISACGALTPLDMVLPWRAAIRHQDALFAPEMTVLGILGLDDAGALERIVKEYTQVKHDEWAHHAAKRKRAELDRAESARRALEFRRAAAETDLRNRNRHCTDPEMPYASFEQVAQIHPNALRCIGYEAMLKHPTNPDVAAEVFCRLETLVQWLDVTRTQQWSPDLDEHWQSYCAFTWTWQLDWLMQPRVFSAVETMMRRDSTYESRARTIRMVVKCLYWLLCDRSHLLFAEPMDADSNKCKWRACFQFGRTTAPDEIGVDGDPNELLPPVWHARIAQRLYNPARLRRRVGVEPTVTVTSACTLDALVHMRTAVLQADPDALRVMPTRPPVVLLANEGQGQLKAVLREVACAGMLDWFQGGLPRPSPRAVVASLNLIGAESAVRRVRPTEHDVVEDGYTLVADQYMDPVYSREVVHFIDSE